MASTASTKAPPSIQCAYERWNATTNCWNYRSCAHCLETPGCMIGQSGMCEPLDGATAQHNYTRAFALNLTLPAAKDSMNDTMKRVTQQWEFPSSSVIRFCVGANGCVCISTCEFSSLQPYCEEEPQQPSATGATTLPTFEQCQYASQDRITGCYVKRSCRDCLAKPGCRIAMDGYCEPDSDANFDSPEQFDYRLALKYNLSLPAARQTNASALAAQQYWHFPASALEYCATSDPVCQQCVEQDYWLSPGKPRDSRFCVGTDNCICVANCARDDNATQCPKPSTSVDYDDSYEDWSAFRVFIILLFIGLAVCIIGCTWYMCYCCKRRRRKRWEDIQVARLVGDGEITPNEATNATAMYVVVRPA